MKRNWILAGTTATTLALLWAMPARAADKEENEQKTAWKDVPSAAQKTLTREAFGARIATVDKEKFKGKTAYEADVKIDGHNYEIVVDEHGLLLAKSLDEGDEASEAGETHQGPAKGEKDEHEDKDGK